MVLPNKHPLIVINKKINKNLTYEIVIGSKW